MDRFSYRSLEEARNEDAEILRLMEIAWLAAPGVPEGGEDAYG